MEDARAAVTLSPMPAERLCWVVALEADSATQPFIVPWSLERHRSALRDPDLRHLLLVGPNGAVGFAILAGLRDSPAVVELRRLVIAPEDRGRGFGRTALGVLINHVFDDLGAHRLWLDVVTDNARARGLYVSRGFRPEGVLRDHLATADGFRSVEVLAILASERSP